MICINLMTAAMRAALRNRRCRERHLEEYRIRARKNSSLYYHRNPEKVKAYQNSPQGKPKIRERCLNRYGWTTVMFEDTLLELGNACAICRLPFTQDDPVCADHAHTNPPMPRSLLHRSCNAAIGLLRDDSEMCRAAADYLDSWRK